MEPDRNYNSRNIEMGHYQGIEFYNGVEVNLFPGIASPSEDGSQKQPLQTISNIYEEDHRSRLHRDLKTRQVSMIALGGALGTGLLINTFVWLICFASTLLMRLVAQYLPRSVQVHCCSDIL
jgi:amino acid permease